MTPSNPPPENRPAKPVDHEIDPEVLALAVHCSNAGAWDWKIGDNHFFYSEHCRVLLGYAGGEAFPGIFEDPAGIVHPADLEGFRTALDDHLQPNGTQRFDVECRLLTRSGDPEWFRVRGMAQRTDDGEATRLTGFLTSVRYRKQVEEELENERHLLRTILEHVPVNIYIKDLESRFIRTNPSMAKWFNLDDPGDLVGKSDRDFFEKEHWGQALDDEKHIIESEEPMIGRLEKETWPNGERTWVLTSKMPYYDKNDKLAGTFGVSSDVSELVNTQIALENALENLEASNRDLEQFAYVASHDLQEPLRMVSSYVQLLSRRYKGKLDDSADDFIGYAVEGVTRMQRLIQDLLTYSRVGTGGRKAREFDVQKTLDAVLANLQLAIADSNATVTADPMPTLYADPTQISQLLQNLIANAIKFRGDKPPAIHISAKEEEDNWLFCVKDDGIGIDAEHADRIFQIFKRLHRRDEYEGTGIGLAVCKKIVERNGGRIWVESEANKGCAFFFTLPFNQTDDDTDDDDSEGE